MPATYINDQWVQQDQLGLGRAGDELARMSLEVNRLSPSGLPANGVAAKPV
ncbi:hypothetical protein [Methylomonas koyamae]|uniref:hypothetical protein n=1 Tax=Methylomonas koyamae TaxID=702114 RepID=UPI000A4A7C61|nr:hypothetical protein [Methylomonas koyamae]